MGTLRISGGSLAGRTVQVPPGIIRPAMDRMRESLFAVLGNLEGRSFLDLFSGSGIIALEAASRGAAVIEAVEADPLKRKTILANAALSPVRIGCRFMAAELYIKRAKKSFDLIFCDPPFSYRYKRDLILAIAASVLMKENTILLIHRPGTEILDQDSLDLRETRIYGNSKVDFFVPKSSGVPAEKTFQHEEKILDCLSNT